MSPDSSHGAAGNALGYFHQCMWALVELAKRASDDPACQLRLEALDDIEFGIDGTPSELLQTKHQVQPASDLTAYNADVWRSLNVWMDMRRSWEGSSPILRLVTTATAPVGSPLACLRSDSGRDVQAALQALVTAAEESKSKKTADWRKKFLDLQVHDRLSLVECIVVEDGSTIAREIDAPLLSILRYAIARGNEDSFLQQIKGWWAGIAVRLLDGSLPAITGHDLQSYVEDLVDQFRSDTLPVSLAIQNSPFVEEDSRAFHDREFVQQLFWIALDNRRLWKAIRDYHRSYAQRSEWLRNNLVAEVELDRFACALHDEWEQIFDEKVEQVARGEIEEKHAGREVLSLLARDARARLRDRFDQPWFTRGMIHAIADGYAGYRIGWHPDFQLKLESLLVDVSV
ncbi:ABC-three component system protein [Amycolatopsis granulosa]|uniref:ABC-three component system protein n=1 Tax=Amycolatopsis granulosa TaxID=185684 RepID=UPI00141F07C2|nr:ABC-three component system protein [Amycolatopsis granulosa]NIH84595.1 hypothetical protein [Amycolatopsis granulosa]